MELLFWTILVLSVLSLSYFIVIAIYNGPRTTFSDFWLFSFCTGVLVCIILKYFIIHRIEVHPAMSILLATIIGIGFCIFLCIEAALICYSKQRAEKGMDYIIILGAQVRGTTITKALIKRLDTAVIYLKDNPRTIAIVSGGKGETETLTEAEAMNLYLIQHGVKESRIIKEDKSRNTFENILYSKSLIKPNSKVAIVTNGFHMYRSIRIARRQGMIAQGIAAPTDALLAVNFYVREAIGVLKDKLLGNI